METPNSDLTSYDGNCHCGAFKYTVKVPTKPSHTCDCSYCIRKGYNWVWPIAASDLIIHSGEGSLTEYQFAGKELLHYFCPKCGSAIMAKHLQAPPEKAFGINVRMLKNYVTDKDANESPFHGAEREPKYTPPTLPTHSHEGNLGEGEVVLKGNCHCGAIKYAVKTKPIEVEEEGQKVMSCNCSLCSRNGDLWIYPPKTAVVLEGEENLTGYAFLSKDSLHCFCETCGVSMLVQVLEEGAEDMPINVRTVEGIDLGKLRRIHYDGAKNNPKYEV